MWKWTKLAWTKGFNDCKGKTSQGFTTRHGSLLLAKLFVRFFFENTRGKFVFRFIVYCINWLNSFFFQRFSCLALFLKIWWVFYFSVSWFVTKRDTLTCLGIAPWLHPRGIGHRSYLVWVLLHDTLTCLGIAPWLHPRGIGHLSGEKPWLTHFFISWNKALI